jgi:hypothetical protein
MPPGSARAGGGSSTTSAVLLRWWDAYVNDSSNHPRLQRLHVISTMGQLCHSRRRIIELQLLRATASVEPDPDQPEQGQDGQRQELADDRGVGHRAGCQIPRLRARDWRGRRGRHRRDCVRRVRHGDRSVGVHEKQPHEGDQHDYARDCLLLHRCPAGVGAAGPQSFWSAGV